jgi:hypothetical protein
VREPHQRGEQSKKIATPRRPHFSRFTPSNLKLYRTARRVPDNKRCAVGLEQEVRHPTNATRPGSLASRASFLTT